MSGILLHEIKEIPEPFVVVCEGYGDLRFIYALIQFKNITNCSLGCPSQKGGFGTGKAAIPSYLKGIQTTILRKKANLQGVVVIADADDDRAASFDLMVEALQSAKFPVPAAPFSIEGNPLRVGIFLLPGPGKNGCLEHILWDAVVRKTPTVEQCVADFSTCTGGHITAASENQRAKMRMSALVAAFCKDNPWASPGLMWSDGGNPVPINSVCFNELAAFLTQFTTP
jgi:hypothetical protein